MTHGEGKKERGGKMEGVQVNDRQVLMQEPHVLVYKERQFCILQADTLD